MVEVSRIVEIIAEFSTGTDRGSGYRTSAAAVLTAAHVVANAVRVRVRFDADTADEWETVATCCWCDVDTDIAVLSIEPREGGLPPARFGRIGDRDAVLPATAVGFPLWKLKNYDGTVVTDDGRPRYRDTHQADGMVAVLSNRREGTLEFTVAPPDRDAGPEPWQGMSGAALWVGRRIVGVVARHHRADGLGRLTAARLDRALTVELGELLGITEPLPDVIRPRESELIRTDYRKQVEAIAPERLLDREDDLAEITRFVAGDEPYGWWRAGPWAGKSALMSWFALHPPEGVDVVSFFVTRSLGGQADSDAFIKALALQLAAITGAHEARQDQLWRLLEEAAGHCGRLLVVIDGLDEDSGPVHGKPSIASLLPVRPPPNVRILIASRPDPPVPDDVVDEDHPLLTCPRRELAASRHARSIGRRAVHELNQHLHGDELGREVLGLITACGGGLTRDDLSELTARPPYEIDRLLDGPLGRTIGSRPAPLRPIHLFAHETLGQTAREKFGSSVQAYRSRIHTWADAYREKRWPAATPLYLLIGYPRMLADADDHDRLVAVCTDRVRHDRMLLVSGGDALATSEVRHARDVLSHLPSPDLSGLLLLAAHNEELAQRNSAIPVRLPLVLAMLGEPTRAEALARGITDMESQARSLAALAEFAARTGDRERCHAFVTDAHALADSLFASAARDEVLTELAKLVARAGDADLAISIASEVRTYYARDAVFADLAESAAEDGEYTFALRSCSGIGDAGNRDRTLTRAAWSAAMAGRYEQAGAFLDAVTDVYSLTGMVEEYVAAAVTVGEQEQVHWLLRCVLALALDITAPTIRAWAVARLARTARGAGDPDYAAWLSAEAWTRTHDIADHHERAWALIALSEVVATDDPAQRLAMVSGVEQAVRALPDTSSQAALLSRLAGSTASAGEYERARVLLTESAGQLDQIPDRRAQDRVRGWLVASGSAAGEFAWARAQVEGIADPEEWASAMATLAEAAVDSSDRDQALVRIADLVTLATTFDDRYAVDFVLVRLVEAAARLGDHERALAMTNDIVDTDHRDGVLVHLAEWAFADGDHKRATSLASRILGDRRSQVFANLAEASAVAGDYDLALDLAGRIPTIGALDTLTRLVEATEESEYEQVQKVGALFTENQDRRRALARVARVAAAGGAIDQARMIVRDLTGDRDAATEALADVVVAVAEGGRPDTARNLAHDAGVPDQLPQMLTRLATVAFSTGDPGRARELLDEVAAVTSALPEPGRVFDVLVQAVEHAVAEDAHEQALALARDIAFPSERARALTHLAEAIAIAGDLRAARDLAVEAETVARDVHNPARPDAIAELAAASVLVREQERALRLALAIPRRHNNHRGLRALARLPLAAPGNIAATRSVLTVAMAAAMTFPNIYGRTMALAELADAVAEAGRPELLTPIVDSAADMINASADTEFRAGQLAILARAAIRAGHHDRGRSLLDAAESLASTVPDGEERVRVLSEIAQTAMAAGDFPRARAIAGSITNRDETSRYTRRAVLIALVEAASGAGDHELAESVFRDTDDPSARYEMLEMLMVRAAAVGDHDRARSLTSLETDAYRRADMLTWLAQVATLTGDYDRAWSLGRDIPRIHGSADGLVWFVRAAVAAGDHQRARTLTSELPEDRQPEAEAYLSGETPATPGLYSHTYPTAPVIDTLIAAGDHESALALAHDIDDPFSQARLLIRLVVAEVAAGDLERAITIANEMTRSDDRAGALSLVVDALAAAGNTARARSLLAEVLVLGTWYESVTLIARVAPDALVPVLDDLESRCVSGTRGSAGS